MKLLYDLMWSLLISPYLKTFIMCADIYNVGRYNFAKDTATVVSKLENVMRYFWWQNKICRHLQEIHHKFNPRSTQGDNIDFVRHFGPNLAASTSAAYNVQISKYMLSKLSNIFVQIVKYICSK